MYTAPFILLPPYMGDKVFQTRNRSIMKLISYSAMPQIQSRKQPCIETSDKLNSRTKDVVMQSYKF